MPILILECITSVSMYNLYMGVIVTFFFTVQRSDLTTMETMTEYENQKRILEDLQLRLTEAEQKIVDGENLRKKLHNTILVRTYSLQAS
jgi:uncharacterized membrane protein (DUF106 family)